MCFGPANLEKKIHTKILRAIYFYDLAAFKANNTQNGKILRAFGARRGVMYVRLDARGSKRASHACHGKRHFCVRKAALCVCKEPLLYG